MYIEAVTVCVNYSDYLTWTIGQNKHIFDNYIVVTSPKDKDTIRLCGDHSVKCIQTDVFAEGHHKAAGINVGLDNLKRTDWLCHIDADIVLPNKTRKLLHIAKLNPEKIYGIDRQNIKGFETWIRHLSSPTWPVPLYENEIYLHLAKFEPGARVIKTFKEPEFNHDLGYICPGYFQLWNESPESKNGKRVYDGIHYDYSRGDMEFCCQWDRDKRELIPEIVCYHLMTDDLVKGSNWKGRTTKRFGLD